MSRSRKHVPISGNTCAETEQWWKRKANRKLRRLLRLIQSDEEIIPTLRDVSDVWTWPKDGKHYWIPEDLNEVRRAYSK